MKVNERYYHIIILKTLYIAMTILLVINILHKHLHKV